MGTKVITPPSPLLTADECNLHLKLDSATAAADATRIAGLVMAAHRMAEHYTGISLGTQTLEIALDAFPNVIQLPRGPVTSIVSVKYIDPYQVLQTLDPARYVLDDYSSPQWLVPAYASVWPGTLPMVNAVQVRYVAGAAQVDEAVHAALLLLVAGWYAHPESISSDRPSLAEVPLGVKALLDTVQVWSM